MQTNKVYIYYDDDDDDDDELTWMNVVRLPMTMSTCWDIEMERDWLVKKRLE